MNPLAAHKNHQQDQSLKDWVEGKNLSDFLTYEIKCPITRQNNQFVFS